MRHLTISANVPGYLTDYLKLSATQMGFITSAIGFGGLFGQTIMSGLSDWSDASWSRCWVS